jgi:heterodisulfide reductase subunit A-like polyferredoxin
MLSTAGYWVLFLGRGLYKRVRGYREVLDVPQTVCIIRAGIAGLTAGCYLAKAGYDM